MAEKEYINRNELIDDFQNDLINLHFDGLKGTPRPKEIKITNVIERIEDFPTADVIPAKHGEWGEQTYSRFYGMDKNGEPIYRDGVLYYCSECSRRSIIKTNFCPDCGAKMDGGDKNED